MRALPPPPGRVTAARPQRARVVHSLASMPAMMPPATRPEPSPPAVLRVSPAELSAILPRFQGVKVLSLDCFDTVIWRRCASPTDVFHDLEHAPAFAELGFNAALRQRAEATARALARVRSGRTEVKLPEIYRAAFPHLGDTEIARLAAAELEAEARACFAHPAAVRLIEEARDRGLKIVVVSDTYLGHQELRALLERVLPAAALRALHRLFCSSDAGVSKSTGLFRIVLERLSVRADQVVHLGDNEIADADAPANLGIRAVHLAHATGHVAQASRLAVAAGSLLHPAPRRSRSQPAPYAPILAASAVSDPAEALGRVGVGPVVHAFARWIRARQETLSAAGGQPPKLLFLLRDGWLPMLAYRAIYGDAGTHPVEISRFAAYAASFRTRDDVDRYLARMAGPALESLARQLLFTPGEVAALCDAARGAAQPFEALCGLVRSPERLASVLERSRAYRARLRAYLEREVGLAQGDRLLFVDLGYTGTAQMVLEPLLAEEWGIEVQGAYLLLARTPGWERSRAGLIDPSVVDDAAIAALVRYVAALEQACTADHGSVIDYTADGAPVRKPPDISREQYDRVLRVQAACLELVREAERFFEAVGSPPALEDLRIDALGQLGRLLFYPTQEEITALRGFELDVNLATDTTVPLVDDAAARVGLRRHGLAYTLLEGRMNQPMEVRAFGFELATTLLTQHRFGWDVAVDDFSHERLDVPVLLARDGAVSASVARARPTFDGYFAAVVAVGAGEYEVAFQVGAVCGWLQLESAILVPVRELFAPRTALGERLVEEIDVTAELVRDGIDTYDGGVLRCRSQGSLLFLSTRPHRSSGRRLACRLVFRPLVRRGEDARPAAGAVPRATAGALSEAAP
ncbi:MAG: HAD family hydrolase [Polyangiaceae bacterium]|nr:HAD family hydrolase [Polyangiaceae bacterium]